MPRWAADRDAIAGKYPDERWVATCPAEHVALFLRYDHHTVWIGNRMAVLLTFEWHSREDRTQDLPMQVSFTYAPGHPSAPDEVQRIAERLTWQPLP